MTKSRTTVVVLFIVLEVLAALGMLALSVHGPSGLSTSAFVYVVVAVTATWLAGRRAGSTLVVVGLGLAFVGIVPGIFALLGKLDDVAYKRRVAATRVTDVRDEPIVSSTGNAIGIRVSYNVTVPARGYFAPLPSLLARDARASNLRVNATRWTIDGSRDPVLLEPDETHAMVVEMYPAILFFQREQRCLETSLTVALPDSSTAAPLRVMISDSPYGNIYNGQPEQVTARAYDVVALYRGLLAEGLAPCKAPG